MARHLMMSLSPPGSTMHTSRSPREILPLAASEDPSYARLLADRLIAKSVVDTATECWRWMGSAQPTGYGQMWNGFRPEQAHRIAYRTFIGPISPELEIDHICRKRDCINPFHLRQVTHRQNMQASESVMGVNARKTKCSRGHLLSGENLVLTKSGTRQCRCCMNMSAKRYREARKRRSETSCVLFGDRSLSVPMAAQPDRARIDSSGRRG
ncbi:HNH endonuclease signature motif containing protein [Lysobacter sp. CA199]|uniref:HNH endonuclease signature motif containing protein n=1 Tax=Lysobacter sp. CA199 TaxID=3455608 RepID=UPI003F8D2561